MRKTKAPIPQPIYETPDLQVAAFLISENCKLIKAHRDPNDHERILILFEDKNSCEKLEREFFSGAKVSALLYAKSLERAKDELFAVKRGTQ